MITLIAVWFVRVLLILAMLSSAAILTWFGIFVFNFLTFVFYATREEITGTPIPNGYVKKIDSKKIYVKTGLYRVVE